MDTTGDLDVTVITDDSIEVNGEVVPWDDLVVAYKAMMDADDDESKAAKDDWHFTKSDIRKLIAMIDKELAKRKRAKEKQGKSADDATVEELEEELFESCPSRVGKTKGQWFGSVRKWVGTAATRSITGYRRRLVMIGTKMGMSFGGGKSFSLDERRRQVRDAWRSQFVKPGLPGQPVSDEYWVKEVFDDQVIVETPQGLAGYPYIINDEGEIEFGQPTKVKIVYQPVTSKALAVKALREEDGGMVVGGYLLLWGTPEQKDLGGDYFTPDTELWLDAYKSVPALFHHGLDQDVGLAVMGKRVAHKTDDMGVWVEDWLDKANAFWTMVKPLLDAEALYYSPGSAPHLVKREEDGKLKSFPVIEDTLTPIPMQHRLLPVEQIQKAYKAVGLELPQLGGDEAGASCLEAAKIKARAELLLTQIDEEE